MSMLDGLEWERREREAREADERDKAVMILAEHIKKNFIFINEILKFKKQKTLEERKLVAKLLRSHLWRSPDTQIMLTKLATMLEDQDYKGP